MLVDSEHLDELIRDSGMAKWKIAEKMGMSRQNLYKKVHNQVPFFVDEAIILMDILGLDFENEFLPIFFADKVHKNVD